MHASNLDVPCCPTNPRGIHNVKYGDESGPTLTAERLASSAVLRMVQHASSGGSPRSWYKVSAE